MIYRDREQAARLLVQELAEYRGRRPLVLAIPRGSIVMARIIADALEGDLDVVLVRKLGVPEQPEFAVGAVDEQGEVYLTEAARRAHVQPSYLREERARQLALLRQRRRLYTPDRPPISAFGRVVLVVDDGVATGATMIAALHAIRDRNPSELVAVAAVMPREIYRRLAREADRVVCLQTPENFFAVGEYFVDFSPVSDAEVAQTLGGTLASA